MGPKGVHVAHAVIDGVIDIPRTADWNMGPDGKIDPNAVSGIRCHDPYSMMVLTGGIYPDCGCVLASTHSAEDGVYVGNRHKARG